ncbi:hypothetical protein EVAR_30815_1 [Eumeta japonica]|uniref:Uncharacterized protein n=1 Tax=Eumeta variegata TaxID=151549 RepID=A0A4C2ABB3_EUMVA|nr:hypothetical protein EVAR_30815_1 [Eumeta japonica]
MSVAFVIELQQVRILIADLSTGEFLTRGDFKDSLHASDQSGEFCVAVPNLPWASAKGLGPAEDDPHQFRESIVGRMEAK